MKKFLPKTINNPQGFTLVELLVVISIIAILSVLGISLFGGVQQRARDARRRSDIAAIKNALEQRFVSGIGYSGPLVSTWFANNALPTDPGTLNAANYGAPTSVVTGFTICATLENPSGTSTCVFNQ